MGAQSPFEPMPKGFDLGQAIAEAGRCLLCHEAPCSKGCPALTDPGTFIRKLRLRNVTGAIRTVKHNNILGGACGILCPTARLCEKECCATGIDRPIRIGQIQRFLVEHAKAIGFRAFDPSHFRRPAPRTERIAVVGAGPAGIACAAELAKEGFSVTVFESRARAGGVLRYGVPPFRFGDDFLDSELEDLKDLEVEFRFSKAISNQGEAEKLLGKGFKAVFVGTGLWSAQRLRIGAASTPGVVSSVDFLSALREGKAMSFQKRFKNQPIAVIGGGSVAMDCARAAQRLGARDVYLVYRRSFGQMPAELDERIEALQDGIHFLVLNQPIEYITEAKNGLVGIRLARTRLLEPDASGRRSPREIPESEWTLEAKECIEAIGSQVGSEGSRAWPSLHLRKDRTIEIDDRGQTSAPGIFAGGDIARGPGLVVEAVRDGKTAARAVIDYLEK